MKKTIAELEKLRQKSMRINRNCFEKGCNSKSIDSHILQKNGVISRITEKGYVTECVLNPFKEYHLKFKRTGINEVFTFKGFCQDHDNGLFNEIEKSSFDLNNYRHQLLFAYRTSVNESRKKESAIDYYKSVAGNPLFNFDNIYLQNKIASEKMGIADSDYTRSVLKENLADPHKHDFIFYTRELPLFEVCISAVCTYETSFEIKRMELETNPKFFKPLTDVFITMVPSVENSILSIGFIEDYNPNCNNFYCNLFKKGNESIIQYISDLMLLQIENWITSNSFYYSNIFPNESKIKSIINWAQKNWDEHLTLDFNIFK